MAEQATDHAEPRVVLRKLDELMKKNAWDQMIPFADQVPMPVTPPWAPVADLISFALSHAGHPEEAIVVAKAAWDAAPSGRRASSLAYLHYSILLAATRGGAKLSAAERDHHRHEFDHWLGEALQRNTTPIKDLYRLGNLEAQVENNHDAAALKAFKEVWQLWSGMTPAMRERRHDFHPYVVKSLYGGARSALRLGRLEEARRLCFQCIRTDNGKGRIAPLFQLYLAGKICHAIARDHRKHGRANQADQWVEHARRAYRKALEAKGPKDRDFVFVKLADLEIFCDDLDAARRWIEDNIPPRRRKADHWRLLGDIERAAGNLEQAELRYQNALQKDRAGRHLTLTALGRVQLALGKTKKAEKSFRKANQFRQKRYQSVHRDALRGLADALEARGKTDEAAQVRRQLDQARRREGIPDYVALDGDHHRTEPEKEAS